MTNEKEKLGPYSLDSQIIKHKGASVRTIINSPNFDNLIQNLDTEYEYDIGFVPNGYEHRPDLISNVFYGSPKNWWLLMLVNNISDPFEGFYVNQRILIPRI
jgi:hypothetical protein